MNHEPVPIKQQHYNQELDDYELKAFDIHIDHWNLSPYLRSDWKRHRVIAKVELVGTPAEYEAYYTVEKQGELVNPITHPFYLQGIHWTVAPTVTNTPARHGSLLDA